jgi:hypothetical protein
VEVRPIQSNLRFFFTDKKARVLERGSCILSKRGAICPIFEGDMPPKKYTPKSGAVNGTITGILLNILIDSLVQYSQVVCNKKLNSFPGYMMLTLADYIKTTAATATIE